MKKLLLLGCLFLAGCLGSTEVADNPTDPTTESFAPGLGVNIPDMQKVAVGNGFVYIKDLQVGTGSQLTAPNAVVMTYETFLVNGALVDFGNSVPFDTSVAVPGLQVGMLGMNIGGIRLIVVPSELAYGAEGKPPVIPHNATLVYEVRLEELP
ncbi:MAG TPA: FKBP-type peptidyl-prolyl cis-trans isomerase [Gemmatimonadaceae bacterium]|jgi:peptidylprolyl isomerase|nr:FKBP-type peptidyl-prolyl cis-trans isomerase [Gemmatimonadaceae bacterium]